MPKRKTIAPRTSHEKETITVELKVKSVESVCEASSQKNQFKDSGGMRRDELFLFTVIDQLTYDWLKPEFRTGALKGLRAARIHYDAGLAGRSCKATLF